MSSYVLYSTYRNSYMFLSITLGNCDVELFSFFFLRNGFTPLLILSIHPLPGAYLGLCCFFPQAACWRPSLGPWSIPQLDGMSNIIHPICSGLVSTSYMPKNWGHECVPHCSPSSTTNFQCAACINENLYIGWVGTWNLLLIYRKALETFIYI